VKSFIAVLIAVTAVAFGVGFYMIQPTPSFYLESLILLALTTGGLYFFLVKTKRDRPDFFVPLFLATLVIKLLAMGAFLFVMVLDDPAGAIPNAVSFLVLYLIFTALEIGFLYPQITRR
jgi:uncharacterized phage infection (PIP) family protein YhgE